MGMIFLPDWCKKNSYSFPLQREQTTNVERPHYKYYSTEDKVSAHNLTWMKSNSLCLYLWIPMLHLLLSNLLTCVILEKEILVHLDITCKFIYTRFNNSILFHYHCIVMKVTYSYYLLYLTVEQGS